MKVFISGGCKNGKSTIAEDIAVKLAAGEPLYYMATMIPHDEEDLERIARHIEARRGKGFLTVECGNSLCDGLNTVMETQKENHVSCLSDNSAGKTERVSGKPVYLVDSVTALLSNRYERPDLVLNDLGEFCKRVENAVFVSDFIYSARESYSELTEEYRKGLALCDRYLAEISDTVIEVCAGQAFCYKGSYPKGSNTKGSNMKGRNTKGISPAAYGPDEITGGRS